MKKLFLLGALLVLLFGVCKVWIEETELERVYIIDK